MINSVNSVNTENLNAAKTSETASTLKTEKDVSEVSAEKKVYDQVKDKKDTVEISNSGKGLSESEISSLRDSMQQNKLNLVMNMVNSANNVYKKRGISLNDESSLIQAYNTQRYLARNAYKMYYNRKSDDLDEVNSLKEQISSLEKEIASEEEKNKVTAAEKTDKKTDKTDVNKTDGKTNVKTDVNKSENAGEVSKK